METYVLRLWLPDRPGALGAVASRVGAVRGDVVDIDVLESVGARVIDEVVVALPDASVLELLVAEVAEVDGVEVEDVRPLPAAARTAQTDPLAAAVRLVEATTRGALLRVLCEDACADFDASWCTVAAEGSAVLTESGAPADRRCSADEVVTCELTGAGLVLALGRPGRPFRGRERRRAAGLARIAGLRLAELDDLREASAPRPLDGPEPPGV